MVLRILETVERLSESQVSNNIKGCEVVPGHHINGTCATVDILMKTLHQKVNIALDYGFLTAQRAFRECVRQQTSKAGMVGIIGDDDAGSFSRSRCIESMVFGLLAMANTCAVDWLPSCPVYERKFIGSNANYIAVLLMQCFGSLWKPAT